MGPEIDGTALLLTNSYIVEMFGVDDSDGIYVRGQIPGQSVTLTGSVIAQGDDDGIDTLGANLRVENCIVRNWTNPFEDSKGISLAGGECQIRHCLIVDTAIGVSGKGNNGEAVLLKIDRSTILATGYAVGATNKSGTVPVIDYRITNSILRGINDSVFTSYRREDIHIDYSNIGEPWAGAGNITAGAGFLDTAAHDFHLQTGSPCIDSGDPSSPLDPDGSRADMGFFVFIPPPPLLGTPRLLSSSAFEFLFSAYPNRNYVVEVSTNCESWGTFTTIMQTNDTEVVSDTTAAGETKRFYRAHLAP
jgi:hypothetical protein